MARVLKRRHEFGRIAILELLPSDRRARCHQAAETLIRLRHMGHQCEFVGGVESYDGPYRPACGEEDPEPPIRKDALDEVLAQCRIVQPALFLNRKERKAGNQGAGKQPAARPHGHPGGAVHLDALEPARG